jgi:hypothetical protein
VTSTLLLVATALHLGFQATVTVLVYPALARTAPADWSRVHGAHTRRITPLVAVVYGLLAVGAGLAVITDPDDAGVWVAGTGAAGAALVTAVRAGPLHGRLAHGYDAELVRSLVRADRLRLVAAAVAVAGAVSAAG